MIWYLLPTRVYRLLRSNSVVAPTMQGVNGYFRMLNRLQIRSGEHRAFVGGMWDEIGKLQFEFLKEQGLMPQHNLLDVGCGALRGGLHFIHYLELGNYYGIDINQSLLDAGHLELRRHGLEEQRPNLVCDARFSFGRFQTTFDYAIGVSIFTHLFANHIKRCLAEISKVLKPTGVFYATYFEAPRAVHTEDVDQGDGLMTHFDLDPFHYSRGELADMAMSCGLQVGFADDWYHPRNQRMAVFRRFAGIPVTRIAASGDE